MRLLEPFKLPAFLDESEAREFYRVDDVKKFEQRRFFMFFGVGAMAAHAALDIFASELYSNQLFTVRAIVCVLMLVLSFILARQVSRFADDTIISTYLSVAAIGILTMCYIVEEGPADTYPFGLLILMAYGGAVLSVRFWKTALLCSANVVGFWITVPFSQISSGAIVVMAFFLTVGMLAVAIGSLTRERLERYATRYAADLDKATNEAVKSRDEAVQARKAQSEFIGSLTHELKTPLNAVIGFADLSLQEPFGPIGNEKYTEYLQLIKEAGQAQLVNVEDLLNLRRLETGKMSWSDTSVDISTAIGTAVAHTSSDAEKAQVNVVTSNDLPELQLWTDKTRIVQVINNLLTNAYRWTDPGGSVHISSVLLSCGRLRISVTDTGCGISPQDLIRIQGMFEQAGDGSASMAKGGLGVGLAIVRGILDMMDSQLVMESEVGVGTTCHIDIHPSRILTEDSEQLVGT